MFLIVFMFMLTGVYYFFDIKKNSIYRKWFWTIIFSIWFSVFFAIILPNYPISSGVIGYELFEILLNKIKVDLIKILFNL